MTIQEVIDRTIVAIYSERTLAEQLVLKGGSALRLFDNESRRLSTDADFSVSGRLESPDTFFRRMRLAIQKAFSAENLIVIDFTHMPRPQRRKAGLPEWWAGWLCEFKLVSSAFAERPHEAQRRNAIIPEGAAKSKINIEISESEFCESVRTKGFEGVTIHGYTKELLTLEKLRAICQQHPSYPYTTPKNRARDFFDIYAISRPITDSFIRRCKPMLPKVFAAKQVPLSLLSAFWDDAFIATQQSGFDEVRDTVTGPIHDFDVYLEHLRYLIQHLHPEENH